MCGASPVLYAFLYFIWKDAGHSWRYGCLCTQFIHRFYRGPFGHLTRERTARRNGLEKAIMLFFHRPSPTKHVILSDSNTERKSYTPTTCHIHSKLPFSGFLGWMHTYSLLAFMDDSHSLCTAYQDTAYSTALTSRELYYMRFFKLSGILFTYSPSLAV